MEKIKFEIEMTMTEYLPDQPGFAKCWFKDADGIIIHIFEKIPVLTVQDIDEKTILPCLIALPGYVYKEEYESKEILNFCIPYLISKIKMVYLNLLSTKRN